MKVWIVLAESGQYEDYRKEVCGVFSTEEMANLWAETVARSVKELAARIKEALGDGESVVQRDAERSVRERGRSELKARFGFDSFWFDDSFYAEEFEVDSLPIGREAA